MPFMSTPKNLLSVLLLSVIAAEAAQAVQPAQAYRFGGWTLLAPAGLFVDGTAPAAMAGQGVEVLAYWQDGQERAVALRFDGAVPPQDAVVLKSHRDSRRIKGCDFGAGARVTPLTVALSAVTEIRDLPDDTSVLLPGNDRSLRRVGDLLVADLRGVRVQLAEDSPIVRAGEWDSAEFCRFELKAEGEDE